MRHNDVMNIFLDEYLFSENDKDIYDCFISNQYKELNLDEFETDYSWEYWKDSRITPTIISEWQNLEKESKSVISKGSRVLSVGGGGTSNTHESLGKNCELFVILNPSKWDLQRAKEVHGAKNVRVRGVAEKLPFKDNIFDVVEIPATIDHFQDPLRALHECHRVTQHRGVVVITCGNRKSWYHILFSPLNFIIHRAHDHAHTWHVDIKSLRRLLVDAEFREIEFKTTAFLKLPKFMERRITSVNLLKIHNYISNRLLPKVFGRNGGGMIVAKAMVTKRI